MRRNPHFILDDPEVVKRLIRENPWATLVSQTSTGMVASHYPILLEEDRDEISVVCHFGRPDDELHELGDHEMMIIVQGPHGYISPSWYENDERFPTWNHATAHLYGKPELLTPEATFAIIERVTDHFEQPVSGVGTLNPVIERAQKVALGTAGMRLVVDRFDARLKLSQNKTTEVIERIISQLETGNNYRNRPLAREMRLHFGEGSSNEGVDPVS